MRTGLLGQKIGMSRVLTEKGEHIPITLVHVENCQVVSVKTQEANGYTAVEIGVGKQKASRLSKALAGHFSKNKVESKAKTAEFRVSPEALLPAGAFISVEHFKPGQLIDVQGTTVGKGFSGVMKRWNFGGLRASHGVSITHRSHGSTGQRQDPGRVFKGKKMAGHYGCETVTQQNLKVVFVDVERQLIGVAGAVPGAKGSYLRMSDAVKVKQTDLPFPASLLAQAEESSAVQAAAVVAPQEPSATETQNPTE